MLGSFFVFQTKLPLRPNDRLVKAIPALLLQPAVPPVRNTHLPTKNPILSFHIATAMLVASSILGKEKVLLSRLIPKLRTLLGNISGDVPLRIDTGIWTRTMDIPMRLHLRGITPCTLGPEGTGCIQVPEAILLAITTIRTTPI